MLTRLILRNFVIVSHLALDVKEGLTVLTGETGAGKSILLDAIGLILGARADTSVIKEGAERTDVTAEFTLSESVKAWLQEEALDTEDDTLLVRRTMDVKGRSRAWINGIVVSVSQLKTLGELLIDVHGQHAHQSLIKPAHQLSLLDGYAKAQDALREVEQAYQTWHKAHQAVLDATENQATIKDRQERLQWVIEDIEALQPKLNEWESLNAEHSRLANAVSIVEGLNRSVDVLTEGDEALADHLAHVCTELDHLGRYDERLATMANALNEALSVIEETSRDLQRYLDRNDLDEARFATIDERVTLYFELAHKFHTEPEGLLPLYMESKQELERLTQTQDLEALSRQEQEALSHYKEAAKKLTVLRQKGAKALSEAVTQKMQTLSMKGARFDIELVPNAPRETGSEHCEFLIAGHAGVKTKPLAKVASGGELARISLAIAVITATLTPVPTLIFDEVDSGIGGATAEVVGQGLRELGLSRQVLCVTHLPQVAACGHHHWKVEKMEVEGTTESRLSVLTDDQRTWEVARMLTGLEISQNALDVANEMLDQDS